MSLGLAIWPLWSAIAAGFLHYRKDNSITRSAMFVAVALFLACFAPVSIVVFHWTRFLGESVAAIPDHQITVALILGHVAFWIGFVWWLNDDNY